jgi:hypothetical protein
MAKVRRIKPWIKLILDSSEVDAEIKQGTVANPPYARWYAVESAKTTRFLVVLDGKRAG